MSATVKESTSRYAWILKVPCQSSLPFSLSTLSSLFHFPFSFFPSFVVFLPIFDFVLIFLLRHVGISPGDVVYACDGQMNDILFWIRQSSGVLHYYLINCNRVVNDCTLQLNQLTPEEVGSVWLFALLPPILSQCCLLPPLTHSSIWLLFSHPKPKRSNPFLFRLRTVELSRNFPSFWVMRILLPAPLCTLFCFMITLILLR